MSSSSQAGNRVRPRLGLAGALVAAGLGLAGCGSDTARVGDVQLVRELVTQRASRSAARTAQPVQPTRAAVAAVGLPVIVATIEKLNSTALMADIGHNGTVTTYTSGDASTVSLDRGVMVATRGFPGDLMSASVPSAATLARASGNHVRVHYLAGELDRSVRRDFACTLSAGGPETLVIAEVAYATRIVDEACSDGSSSFSNRFWFESSGKIRQSRQWLGETVGYLKLSDPGR